MENEIKVNDYVRLEDGTIAKVLEIKNQDTDILNWYCLDNDMGAMDRGIVKHSSNLIDIIEERRLCKWNISNRKRKHIIMDGNKRNR